MQYPSSGLQKYPAQQYGQQPYGQQPMRNPSDFGYQNYHQQQREQLRGAMQGPKAMRGPDGKVYGSTNTRNGQMMSFVYSEEDGKESILFNGGECRYEDDFLHENGTSQRPLTDEEKRQLAQFKQEVSVYNENFAKAMNQMTQSIMNNPFDLNGFRNETPEFPQVPCFCAKCKATDRNKKH
jgi:hypothetical protein